MRHLACRALVGLAAVSAIAVVSAQTAGMFVPRDHPAIQYSPRAPHDAVVDLNASIQKGTAGLSFEPLPRGYLASVLKALNIPISSQTLVFSENSLQRSHISQRTPRAIYFNDAVAVAWAKGAETIEVIALDPSQGVHFYSIPQTRQAKPHFIHRNKDCLQCHLLPQTHGVPGVLTMSVLPLSDNKNDYAQGWEADHRTPYEDRWGGWYVTGAQVPAKHLGNVPVLHVPKSYVRADVAPKLPTATDPRHCVRARRLHAVCGRSAAPVAGARVIRFQHGLSVEGPARQQRPFAARPRSHTPPASISLQLHDLHRGIRRTRAACEGGRVRPDVEDFVGRGEKSRLRETIARRS